MSKDELRSRLLTLVDKQHQDGSDSLSEAEYTGYRSSIVYGSQAELESIASDCGLEEAATPGMKYFRVSQRVVLNISQLVQTDDEDKASDKATFFIEETLISAVKKESGGTDTCRVALIEDTDVYETDEMDSLIPKIEDYLDSIVELSMAEINSFIGGVIANSLDYRTILDSTCLRQVLIAYSGTGSNAPTDEELLAAYRLKRESE